MCCQGMPGSSIPFTSPRVLLRALPAWHGRAWLGKLLCWAMNAPGQLAGHFFVFGLHDFCIERSVLLVAVPGSLEDAFRCKGSAT